MSSLFKKIVNDLWGNKIRSILVMCSIAIGVFAVGVMVTTMINVKHDVELDFFSTNPHTSRIYCSEFDTNLLEQLRNLPQVESIGASYNLWLKIAGSNDRQYPINLNSIDSLESIIVDRLVLETGASSLKEGEIYLERQAAEALGLQTGDSINLILNEGQIYPLRLAGTIHDAQANPFKFNGSTSGFVTYATMEKIGGSVLNNFVNLVTTGDHTDSDLVRQKSEEVAEVITANGLTIYNVNVNRPGHPPSQAILDTVMSLLGLLSILVVFLSTFLVTNTVSSLVRQQLRQIGIMKAIGATFIQMTGIYVGLVLMFGIGSLMIALPVGAIASYGLTHWLIGMINANPSPFSIPFESIITQLAIGIFVPVLGSLLPIMEGSRCTVQQALTNYGISLHKKAGMIDKIIAFFPMLSRPLILSLRNTFTNKKRLMFTLMTLVLGGAIFIAMFGVQESLYKEVDQTFSYFQGDVNVIFAKIYPVSEIETAIADIPGVTAFENWNVIDANILRPTEKNSDLVVLNILPEKSELIKATMLDGRWINAADTNAIVVSNHFIDLRPDVKLGDTIQVRWNDKTTPFKLVGIFRMSGTYPAPFTYISTSGFTLMGGDTAKANQVKIITDQHSSIRQQEVLTAVQKRLSELGFQATLQTGDEIITQQRSVINILISLLIAMSLLIAVVGGLGLMGTLGMNVLERTREIGVLRSIGAKNTVIFQMVVTEGVFIGLVSWVLGALIAIPITLLLDNTLGEALMTIPIMYIFSTSGLFLWLGIIVIISILSSLLPAQNAMHLTIRETLAYE
jgi:putative ABC transport system permease protein